MRKYLAITLLLISAGMGFSKESELTDFLKKLLSADRLSAVEVHGEFEFFSGYKGESLVPMTSGSFSGVFDPKDGRLKYSFPRYKQPVVDKDGKDAFRESSLNVSFDAKKWTLIRTPKDRWGLPDPASHLVEVTADRPDIFLQSLDQFGFPAFPEMTNVYTSTGLVPFIELISKRESGGVTVDVRSEGELLVVAFESGTVVDQYEFDRSLLFRRRTTTFTKDEDGLRHVTEVLDLLKGREGSAVGPGKVVFSQYRGDKLLIKRVWRITNFSLVSEKYDFGSIIPPKSVVVDKRFEVEFFTKEGGVSE